MPDDFDRIFKIIKTELSRLDQRLSNLEVWEPTTTNTTGIAGGNASYLTLGADSSLANERVFVAGSALSSVDGGAGGNYTLNLDITELTAEASVDSSADYIVIYDSSATSNKKTLVKDIPLPIFVGVLASRSVDQTISDTSWTVVDLTAADTYDTNSFHDPGSNPSRITIPTGKGGYYWLRGSSTFDSNVNGVRAVGFYKNGTLDTYTEVGATTFVERSTIQHLNATDYIELAVYQTSGGDLDISTAFIFVTFLGY